MKKFYSAIFAVGMCTFGCLNVFADEIRTFTPVADTWVRENNPTQRKGSDAKIETQRVEVKDADNQVTGYSYMVGLIGFDFSVPAGMKVKDAVITLVTERYKGREMTVRPYGNDFVESTADWNSEGSFVTDAIAGDNIITTFIPAGQKGKSFGDGGISEANQNPEKWINNINVSDYVKSLPITTTRINILIAQEGDQKGNQNCFYSKEATGASNSNYSTLTLTEEQVKPVLTVTFVEDTDTSSDVLSPIADTYVRKDKAADKYGANGEMEIYTNLPIEREFYGIMNFVLPADAKSENYEITSATLKLTHTMVKGDRNMNIYEYPATIDESNANWNTEASNITEAMAKDPIASYQAKGQTNKSMTDDNITDDYKTADAWTNVIDLTDYLKENPKDLNILIAKNNTEKSDAIKIATKEIGDKVNERSNPFTILAADMKPQLTVVYTKKNSGTTGIEDIEINEAEGPVEYFNLQGVRVENPANGLYIRRQGSKVTKVVIK